MPLFDSSPNEGRYDPIAFGPSLPQGPSSLEASKAAWTGDEQGFWHAHIEGRARKLYDVLYPHFAARDTEFELGSLEDLFEEGRAVAYYNTEEENARHLASMDSLFDDYNTAVLCIKYDHPELFWLESEGATLGGEPDWVMDANGEATGCLVRNTSYGMSEDEIARTQVALDAKVEEALSKVPKDGTDYAQAWAVYRWLCQNVVYAQEVADFYEAGGAQRDNKLFAPYQGADSALVRGVSVCSGYTRAYQLLLDHLSIPCTYVGGMGDPLDPQASHAWNLVCLGGRLGYTDATWADIQNSTHIDLADGTARDIEFNSVDPIYFFMTDADMEFDGRVADEDFFSQAQDYVPQHPYPYAALLPTCNSIIWEDDRYEPGDYHNAAHQIWYRYIESKEDSKE